MSFLPFTHGREKVIVIADVGSDGAGACVALVRDDAPASIICAERSFLTYDEKTPHQTGTNIISALDDVGTKVMGVYSKLQGKGASRPISSVHAIIHTPLITSQMSRAGALFEREELITRDIIGDLVKSALASEKQLDKERFFDGSIASTELNGYRTRRPVGKHAHSVSVDALISGCEPELRTRITESLRKGFGVRNPMLHSDTRALLFATHLNPMHTNTHLIIDISGDSTNCLVVHKDTAEVHLVVEEGTRTILKRIVGNGMTEETLSLMKMISRDACSTPACEQLKASLARVETELVKTFGEAFSKMISERRLPNDLLLIVTPDLAPWLSNFFSRIDLGQFTVTTRPFSTRVFNPQDLGTLIAQSSGPKIDAWLALGVALWSAQEQST